MQGPSLDDFPNGSFFKKKERTTIQVDSQTIYLTKVIKEEYCGRGETYKVLFEGEIIPEGYNCQEDPDLDLGLGRSVIVKFIYQYVLLILV